jgi:hypothetical protein
MVLLPEAGPHVPEGTVLLFSITYVHFVGAPERIRTSDPLVRSLTVLFFFQLHRLLSIIFIVQ